MYMNNITLLCNNRGINVNLVFIRVSKDIIAEMTQIILQITTYCKIEFVHFLPLLPNTILAFNAAARFLHASQGFIPTADVRLLITLPRPISFWETKPGSGTRYFGGLFLLVAGPGFCSRLLFERFFIILFF